jgi:hypothetical protein
MLEGRFRLAPEVGGQVKAVIDTEVQRIFRARRTSGEHEAHDAYAADAPATIVLADGKTDGDRGKGGAAAVNVHVVIDHDALVRGNCLPGERCEISGVGPVNAQWVRAMLGEAFLTAVIKKGRDITTVAHLGRGVPAVVRTAMVVGGRECEVAGCYRRGYLERDHSEVDYANGGPTAWWNRVAVQRPPSPQDERLGCSVHPIRRQPNDSSDQPRRAARPRERGEP